MDKWTWQPARVFRAYTLIELIISLALIAILLSWAVPRFVDTFQKNLLTTQSYRLMNDLFHARSEAIKRNLPVVICRSRDALSCEHSNKSDADWSIGWISFVNADQDKLRDSDETILRIGAAVPAQISLHFNQWWRFTFSPTGVSGSGSFTFCDKLGHHGRRITLYRSGRARISSTGPELTDCPAS